MVRFPPQISPYVPIRVRPMQSSAARLAALLTLLSGATLAWAQAPVPSLVQKPAPAPAPAQPPQAEGADHDRCREDRGRVRTGSHRARPGRVPARGPDDLQRVPALQPGIRPHRGRRRRAPAARHRPLLRSAPALQHAGRHRRVRAADLPRGRRSAGARQRRAARIPRQGPAAAGQGELHHLPAGGRRLGASRRASSSSTTGPRKARPATCACA